MIRVHGTCVAVDGHGVLLRGPSGSGKSDLALRLMDGGARLVADDQCEIRAVEGRLIASSPPTIAGMIEVRGLGVLHVDFLAGVALELVIDLVAPEAVERLPEPAGCALLGRTLPLVALAPFQVSAAAKVRLAVRLATRDIMPRHDESARQ